MQSNLIKKKHKKKNKIKINDFFGCRVVKDVRKISFSFLSYFFLWIIDVFIFYIFSNEINIVSNLVIHVCCNRRMSSANVLQFGVIAIISSRVFDPNFTRLSIQLIQIFAWFSHITTLDLFLLLQLIKHFLL